MGFQTTLIVNNDYLEKISKIKDLGEKIRSVCGGCPKNKEITHGLTAVECHHTSGNTVILTSFCDGKTWPDLTDQEKIHMLDMLKYDLPEGIKITGIKKAKIKLLGKQ